MGKDKDKLGRAATRRIKTSFIGAIYQFEKLFAALFRGTFTEDDELEVPLEKDMTNEELFWYNKYLEFRSNVLRCGNNQIRMFNADLNNFDVRWQGTEFFFNVGD